MTTEEKRTLAVIADGVATLNGERAVVSGTRHEFATVTQVKTGLSAEWSWPSVAHVLAHKNGAFQS